MFVEEYYVKRSTFETMSHYFDVLYGFGISPNAIWNAHKALMNIFEFAYGQILARITKVLSVQFDESSFKMNDKKGYVWMLTAKDAMYLVPPEQGSHHAGQTLWESAWHASDGVQMHGVQHVLCRGAGYTSCTRQKNTR